MKFIIYLIVVIATVIIQISVIPNLTIGGSSPNLILIGLLILLFSTCQTEALWWAGIGGIFMDIFSPLHYGIYTLILIGIYFLVYMIINRFFTRSVAIIIISSFFVCSLLIDLIPFFISNGDWLILIKNASYNTILGTVIYYLISNKLKTKESEYRE